MDYEKEYKKLKADIEKAYLFAQTDSTKAVLEHILPELRESEDERIRKWLIEYFQRNEVKKIIKTDDILAWLEKQKSEEINVKALLTADRLAAAEMTGRLKERKDIVENPQKYGLEKKGEKKPEIKYIYPKFRVGDVIEPAKPNGSYIPVRVRHIGDGSYYCESDDRKAFSSIPIRNENEYVLTEQKPAWSKEDDIMVHDILGWLPIKSRPEYNQRRADWLKSIKDRVQPQSQWKPSDEQIGVIEAVINNRSFQRRHLDSLYEQLKKLQNESN